MAAGRFGVSNDLESQLVRSLRGLRYTRYPSPTKDKLCIFPKDCTHLVLAVAVTSCWTTSHLVVDLGGNALLANDVYVMKGCCL